MYQDDGYYCRLLDISTTSYFCRLKDESITNYRLLDISATSPSRMEDDYTTSCCHQSPPAGSREERLHYQPQGLLQQEKDECITNYKLVDITATSPSRMEDDYTTSCCHQSPPAGP